jgi:hypothetical protein
VGQLAFSEIGIVAKLTRILAVAGISVFVLSTFETDYVLLKTDKLPLAVKALTDASYILSD